jgi:hypothetical protein
MLEKRGDGDPSVLVRIVGVHAKVSWSLFRLANYLVLRYKKVGILRNSSTFLDGERKRNRVSIDPCDKGAVFTSQK